MTRASGRAFRLVGGTLGSVVAAAVLSLLAVSTVVVWYFEVSAPNRQREISEAEHEIARKAAARAQGVLVSAAADGSLTDEDIREAIGGPQWDIRRDEMTWLVRAKFEGTEPVCFSFEIALPAGPETRVTGTELPECPAITPVE